MRRHRELTTFIVSLPFIALMPYLLPRPLEFESGHSLLAVGYVVAVLGLSRFIAIGIEHLPLRRLHRQEKADR